MAMPSLSATTHHPFVNLRPLVHLNQLPLKDHHNPPPPGPPPGHPYNANMGPLAPGGPPPPRWAQGPPLENNGRLLPGGSPPNGRPPSGWGPMMDAFPQQRSKGNHYYYYYNAAPPPHNPNP
ncbi:hypothetical protein C0993_012761 [Termitomyces sp. T159_Od127]|nr:hypothetical protein C0993_012761 [Termitomyces sp. T159_Od127]